MHHRNNTIYSRPCNTRCQHTRPLMRSSVALRDTVAQNSFTAPPIECLVTSSTLLARRAATAYKCARCEHRRPRDIDLQLYHAHGVGGVAALKKMLMNCWYVMQRQATTESRGAAWDASLLSTDSHPLPKKRNTTIIWRPCIQPEVKLQLLRAITSSRTTTELAPRTKPQWDFAPTQVPRCTKSNPTLVAFTTARSNF